MEQEGTYPLPEAQLDRFLFKLLLDYPTQEEELELMRRWGQMTSQPEVTAVADGEQLLELRKQVDQMYMSESVQAYIVELVRATRDLAKQTDSDAEATLSFGASPRASLNLFQASKALAWIRGIDFVNPAAVQAVFVDVMRHRIGLSYEAEAMGVTTDAVLKDLLDKTAVPDMANY